MITKSHLYRARDILKLINIYDLPTYHILEDWLATELCGMVKNDIKFVVIINLSLVDPKFT